MNKQLFSIGLILIAATFTVLFCVLVIPPLLQNPDIIGAFSAGFVNPYASGYAADVVCCWVTLLIWVWYESPRVKHGWVCLLLGLVPGVAVGFAGYLLLRARQINPSKT